MATTWVLGTKIDIHEVDARLTSIFCVEVFAGSGWLKDHCIPQEVRGSNTSSIHISQPEYHHIPTKQADGRHII